MRLVRDWYQPQLERIYEQIHTRIGDLEQLEQLSVHYPSRERFITELTLDPPQATSDLAGTPIAGRGLPGALHRSIRPRAWSGTPCTC